MIFKKKTQPHLTTIRLTIKTMDGIGQLQRISSIITSLGVNIKKTTARKSFINKDLFICKYQLNIKNFETFMKLIEHVEQIEKESKWIRKTSK